MPCGRSNASGWATLFWMVDLGHRRLAGGLHLRAPPVRPRGGAGRRVEADRRRQPGDAHRAGRPATSSPTWRRRSTRWPARWMPRARRSRSRPTRSWPGTRRWRNASRRRPTELRQAQDLLLRSRSLSALGELGAGVAHEINNPLTGALGIVQLLLADLPGGHPATAAAAGSGARGAAHPQDRAEHAAARAAPERHRHDAGRAGARARRRDRAVRPQRAVGRGHRGDPQVRAGAAGARERDPAGGGVHPADPERARRR